MALMLLALSGCSLEQEPAVNSFFAMNTYMTCTAYGENAQDALNEIAGLVRTLESLWSVTDEESEIYRANHSEGKSVEVSSETADVISFALYMAKETGGALDPTIYPVLMAWGFTTDSKQVPASEAVDALLELVDYDRIRLDGTRLTIPNGMQLDLGAVGKGYTADLAAQVLQEHGVESALLNLGGNIQAIGTRPDGSDWRIGVRAPWEEGNLGILEISNAAVVTSGGYENYFEDEAGNFYWHILDPETGRPAHSGLQSVMVAGAEGKECDALSTALFVMGPEQAEQYWRSHEGFELLMVTDEDEILLTEGLAARFTLSEGRTETIRVLER